MTGSNLTAKLGGTDRTSDPGARAQALLAAGMMDEALREISMLDERDVVRLTALGGAVSEGSVAQWLEIKHIFAVDVPHLGLRYPAFQFRADGTPWPSLAVALPDLLAAFAPRALLLWFNSPHPALASSQPRLHLDDPDRLAVAVAESIGPIDYY